MWLTFCLLEGSGAAREHQNTDSPQPVFCNSIFGCECSEVQAKCPRCDKDAESFAAPVLFVVLIDCADTAANMKQGIARPQQNRMGDCAEEGAQDTEDCHKTGDGVFGFGRFAVQQNAKRHLQCKGAEVVQQKVHWLILRGQEAAKHGEGADAVHHEMQE